MNPENLFALTWQVGLIACCSSAILAAAVLSIWGMFDAAGLTDTQKSSLKRGVKISAQPLTPEQRDFLRGMQGDLFVFPLAIAAFAINFSAEKQAIEAFLRESIGKNQSIEPA